MSELHEDVAQLQALKAEVDDIWARLYAFGQSAMVKARSKDDSYLQSVLVDLGFLFRELENRFDEERKDAKARKELIGKLIAFNAMQTAGDVDTIRGELATGTPDVSMIADLPKKGTPEYNMLATALNVPTDALQFLRLDWKAITAYVTELMAQGKKVPAGLNKTRPVYATTFRRKK